MTVLSGKRLGSCPSAVLRKSSFERSRKRGVSITVGRVETSKGCIGTSQPEPEVKRPKPGVVKEPEPDIELGTEKPEPGSQDEPGTELEG